MYHFMFGKAQTDPCPLCTMWIDGYNAAAPHLAPNIDFAVVAAAEPAAIKAHATSHAWNNLRLLSAGNTTFKYDLGSEEPDGSTDRVDLGVHTRHADGTVRHLFSKGAQMADDRRERGIDLLSPVWHLLDLTPSRTVRLVPLAELLTHSWSHRFLVRHGDVDPHPKSVMGGKIADGDVVTGLESHRQGLGLVWS